MERELSKWAVTWARRFISINRLVLVHLTTEYFRSAPVAHWLNRVKPVQPVSLKIKYFFKTKRAQACYLNGWIIWCPVLISGQCPSSSAYEQHLDKAEDASHHETDEHVGDIREGLPVDLSLDILVKHVVPGYDDKVEREAILHHLLDAIDEVERATEKVEVAPDEEETRMQMKQPETRPPPMSTKTRNSHFQRCRLHTIYRSWERMESLQKGECEEK